MFVQHINPDSIKESNLIVQPIIFSKHWILIIGRLKERIKSLHEDTEGAFTSDIIKWNLQTVRGITTQSNDVDYGIFVCKYMEKAILRRKADWTFYKDWQKYMPKFRIEFGYVLFLTMKK
ncbi:hypothetical protein IEQ34_020175 [Dendrobium chrysotoxum]|uniref:Ubiquitin-like protease family profile domain-containing protein n=1 Tax=Dendrobium chrysotoxum TaxID=161865 RepID=A0AAV7G1D3_DENCH|nr:hypothetical protein IEQ34_020175 [Dendrobium chrysotoxum]